MEEFLKEWGYWAIFINALIEGEVLLLTAGALAFHGYFHLPHVMAIAFVGAVVHDHTLFYVGRYSGKKFFKRFPRLEQKTEKAMHLLHKYHTAFILSFRFVYGVRTVTPIMVGMTKISHLKYSCLTILAGFVWAIVVAGAGYWFANGIAEFRESFVHAEKYLLIGAALVAAGVFWWWKRRAPK